MATLPLSSQGQFFQHTMIETTTIKYEVCFGWPMHDVTGILFSAIFILCVVQMPYSNILLALGFGLCPVTILLLIMQRSLDFGIVLSKLQCPWISRFKSVARHLIFGLGLYLSMQIYNHHYDIS